VSDFEVGADLRGWRAIERALSTLRAGGSYVKAGVVGDAAAKVEPHGINEDRPAKLTNAQLAAIHEFGTTIATSSRSGGSVVGIPARPFILGTFSLHEAEYRRLLAEKILPAVLRLKLTPEAGLKILGEKMSSDMRNRMVEDPSPFIPNAPSTIRAKMRKGKWNKKGKAAGVAPRPLVDTGRLRKSISYAVVIKDEG
jgi:phage gpG-like protein